MAATNSMTASTRPSEYCVPIIGTGSRMVKLTDSRKFGIWDEMVYQATESVLEVGNQQRDC